MTPVASELSNTRVVWSLESHPVTSDRPPAVDTDKYIKQPDLAIPYESSTSAFLGGLMAACMIGALLLYLQAHCSYFDPDGDGIVWPQDTLKGFHDIGFNWLLSFVAVLVIHGSFAFWTQTRWLPDLRFLIHLKNIHRCKHGSDSATYDTEGRYIPDRFEEIFSKYAKQHAGTAITGKELFNMICANRNVLDPFGWTATTFEWGALWWIAKDERGSLSKERVRASYDGSLWYILAREQTRKHGKMP